MILAALITVFVYLLSNGSSVSINVTTVQSTALLNITLPIKPLGPVIVQNSSGSTIPAILIGNHLIIPVFGNGSFIIQYAPYIIQSPSGYLIINVSSPYTINLFVSNNILLTQLPISLITNFTKVSNGIILQLAPGNYSIGFIPELPTTITNKTTATSTTVSNVSAVTTVTNSTPKVTKPSPSLGPMLYYIVIAAVIAVAALFAYLFVIRHRGPEVNLVIVEGLNPTDKEVLKALIDMGGEAYQADLQRKLNMPKATLWRAIRRLESSGYVQVIKEGRVNKIKLIKRPRLD
ncbi:helix-turn-helix transcriptional regulator [Vulcanisaeta distributa]|uniref:Transcriptional regulator, TrmB n=1 Tax=Vulcanisaeta distributa (strain DSM 14429 / JCM 11212 / NBRC 100878 / IC-017) TaxID=572478 RepID=E1QTN5_VULDI|nr:winged helix-turn-helix transcriptional regulator [Vulcanisaeta distributa]ADN49750.1 transcriptional regulator, TrmB [Vulcanisaeta distributa DSM 14429]